MSRVSTSAAYTLPLVGEVPKTEPTESDMAERIGRAIRYVTRHALDADDLTFLLGAIGLDNEAAAKDLMTPCVSQIDPQVGAASGG